MEELMKVVLNYFWDNGQKIIVRLDIQFNYKKQSYSAYVTTSDDRKHYCFSMFDGKIQCIEI